MNSIGPMRHHGSEDAVDASPASDRAKKLDKAARQRSGRDLTHAIEAAGSTMAACARACGCDPGIIKDICDGARPLTWERVVSLPPSVQRALLEVQLTALRETSPVSRRAPLHHVMRVTVKVGVLAEVVSDAESDGFVDDNELARIERAHLDAVEVHLAGARDARLGRTG